MGRHFRMGIAVPAKFTAELPLDQPRPVKSDTTFVQRQFNITTRAGLLSITQSGEQCRDRCSPTDRID